MSSPALKAAVQAPPIDPLVLKDVHWSDCPQHVCLDGENLSNLLLNDRAKLRRIEQGNAIIKYYEEVCQ